MVPHRLTERPRVTCREQVATESPTAAVAVDRTRSGTTVVSTTKIILLLPRRRYSIIMQSSSPPQVPVHLSIPRSHCITMVEYNTYNIIPLEVPVGTFCQGKQKHARQSRR